MGRNSLMAFRTNKVAVLTEVLEPSLELFHTQEIWFSFPALRSYRTTHQTFSLDNTLWDALDN